MNKKERLETVRELTAHAQHFVKALDKKDLNRAAFHANNANSCLKVLIDEIK